MLNIDNDKWIEILGINNIPNKRGTVKQCSTDNLKEGALPMSIHPSCIHVNFPFHSQDSVKVYCVCSSLSFYETI